MCPGCDQCLDCPARNCPDLDHNCQRYARRTDLNGCVECPVCELWRTNNGVGPAITGQSGFLQVCLFLLSDLSANSKTLQ